MKCALCEDKICAKGEQCRELSDYSSREENIRHYLNDPNDKKILESSSFIPKNIPRLEEIVEYARFMNMKKIGIAFCKGLEDEAELIHKYLSSSGINTFSVICRNGGIDKKAVGVKNISPEKLEITCNPYGQAAVLNSLNTDLNIAVGLCLGHDMLFAKHSTAPVTTLIVKDRVYGHCSIKGLKR